MTFTEGIGKKIIIIGCTSGIGLELARQYLQSGDRVAGCGRNPDKIQDLAREYSESFHPFQLDISISADIAAVIPKMIEALDGLDIFIMSSSISVNNRDLTAEIEESLIHTNVRGYTLCINEALRYFRQTSGGHIAGITSIARFIASKSPGYSASKAWESVYLEGLRIKTAGENIHISEIIPGFVRTPLISSRQNLFWVTPVEKAARQIIRGLDRKKETLYISKRWRLVRWLIAVIPRWTLRKILSAKDNRQ